MNTTVANPNPLQLGYKLPLVIASPRPRYRCLHFSGTYKLWSAKLHSTLRNWQRIKCKITMRKLKSV